MIKHKSISEIVLQNIIDSIEGKLTYSKGCEERKIRVTLEDEEAEIILIILKKRIQKKQKKMKTQKKI